MQIHKIGVPLGDGVTAGKANPLLDHQRPSKTDAQRSDTLTAAPGQMF